MRRRMRSGAAGTETPPAFPRRLRGRGGARCVAGRWLPRRGAGPGLGQGPGRGGRARARAGPFQRAAPVARPGCARHPAAASPLSPVAACPLASPRGRGAESPLPFSPAALPLPPLVPPHPPFAAGCAMAAPSSIVPVMASKTKTKKKHFVAQKVKLFRASDPLLSVLMWGVNHSVRAAPDSAGPTETSPPHAQPGAAGRGGGVSMRGGRGGTDGSGEARAAGSRPPVVALRRGGGVVVGLGAPYRAG